MVYTESKTSVPLHVLAWQYGIQGIDKKAIKDLVGKISQYSDEQNKALRRIYGAELDILKRPGKKENATGLLDPFLHDIFDKGCNRQVECALLYKGKRIVLHEDAVPIYSRSSFISKILEADKQGNPILLSRIDLRRFRDADFDVGDPHGIRPADVIINMTAAVIHDALREIWEEKKLASSSDSYEIGRYGGDEFMIAFVGEQAQANKEEVVKRVVQKLAKKRGFYKDKKTGVIEKIPISLKEDKKTGEVAEWIPIPDRKNKEERTMYMEYLQRGQILNESDFIREKEKYTHDGVFSFAQYRQDVPEEPHPSYPQAIKNMEGKIAYLTAQYPEFNVYFGLAKLFDLEDNTDPSHMKRQKILLRTVETFVFDKLLGGLIYSRAHFIKHMERGEFGELYVLDFKYLKEINSAMTYTDADHAIKIFWDKITNSFSPEERNKIVISRFAGAFYIAVRKGSQLSKESIDHLNNLKSLPIGKENYHVPLGHAHINLKDDFRAHHALHTVEIASDAAYYDGLIGDIVLETKLNSQFLTKLMSIDIQKLLKREYQTLSKIELYALFLRGQRKGARIGKMLDRLDDRSSSGTIDKTLYGMLRGFLEKELR